MSEKFEATPEITEKMFQAMKPLIIDLFTEMLEQHQNPDMQKLRSEFGRHGEALRSLGVTDVGWYGCFRRSGLPFWTWHEMGSMIEDKLEHGHKEYQGLMDAILDFCELVELRFHPSKEEMANCPIKIAI